MKSFLLRAFAVLALAALQPSTLAAPLDDRAGYWMGDLMSSKGTLLKIGVEIYTRADGTQWASVASPDQGAYDIPVKSIVAETDGGMLLDIDNATLKLTWMQDHFRAEWRQGGIRLLELRPVATFPKPARPQSPRPPFPYKEELLAIRSKDGATLGATLTTPHAPARSDVVVLIAGSGPQTRDDHMLVVLADHLARQGIAVLRYDKRGVARSTGDYYHHTLADLENDVYAAVRALAASKKFGRIGLVGHSEGSAIAAAVAALHPKAIDFIVTLGGVGMSGFDLMLLQDRQWALDHGAQPEEVERMMPYVRKYYETVLVTPNGKSRVVALKALYANLAPEEQKLLTKFKMNVGTLSPDMAAQAFLPVSLKSDPRLHWSKVRCAALVLHGSLDHQVHAEKNVAGIVGALRAGGNALVDSAVLPSLNHGFQTAITGKEDEYAKIDETMAPVAMQKIADFVRVRSRAKSRR
jgi:pimeloyl-ACP methyl ester carboxylesterase